MVGTKTALRTSGNAESQRHRLVVWRFVDDKRGHENQSLGLLEALAERMPLAHFEFAVRAGARLRCGLAACLDRPTRAWPDPALLIGAGHATHLALLASRWARGGRIVVLMKPSLPLGWFDLCITPEHDGVEAANVLRTRGPINRAHAARCKQLDQGLVLLGGPSAHYGWDEDTVCDQIKCIASRTPQVAWCVVGSRRTPESTLARIDGLPGDNLRLVRFGAVDTDWLPTHLATASQVWVSADSASMVYEALSAAAATGIIDVPSIGAGRDRVTAGLERLAVDGWVTRFDAWRAGKALRPPPGVLNEAERCAQWIAAHWLGCQA